MAEDLMRYDQLAQNALRGVVRDALRQVQRTGLPGDHHFYIAFNTRYPVSSSVRASPNAIRDEMTVVLQHQFWNLNIYEDRFEVELSFDNIPEKLVIPFNAIKGFLDPAVQFVLQFEVVPLEEQAAPKDAEILEMSAKAKGSSRSRNRKRCSRRGASRRAEVVSLDSFRKK